MFKWFDVLLLTFHRVTKNFEIQAKNPQPSVWGRWNPKQARLTNGIELDDGGVLLLFFSFLKWSCGRLALPKGYKNSLSLSRHLVFRAVTQYRLQERGSRKRGWGCFRGLWLCSSRGFGFSQPSGSHKTKDKVHEKKRDSDWRASLKDWKNKSFESQRMLSEIQRCWSIFCQIFVICQSGCSRIR